MKQWNDSDKHLIHLRADRIIGSGSFGKGYWNLKMFRLCV